MSRDNSLHDADPPAPEGTHQGTGPVGRRRPTRGQKADVALLTEQRYEAETACRGDWYHENILREDRLLQQALQSLGLRSVRLDWARPDVEWGTFRCAVFRTTWDYFHRFQTFAGWLRRIETETRLCNPAALVWWNLDKHYLNDLAERGLPVVPSRFIEPGTPGSLEEWLEQSGWEQVVIKPCVSGSARHTYRVERGSAGRLQSVVRDLLASEALVMQPFQHSVLERGEDTLVVIDGRFTHAVRKRPRPGDFRVQDDYGGTVHPLEPDSEQIELAEAAMQACVPRPVYGRVDMIRDNRGRAAISELELIEPELWFRHHPPAAAAMAGAIARFIDSA